MSAWPTSCEGPIIMERSEMNGATSGELTLKQAGIMLLAIAAILGAVEWTSNRGVFMAGRASTWTVGGIPVHYVAASFGLFGLVLTIVGFVRKA
jgi:hypothetical protein